MMKTLFLHPPSFDGFDGGAGSRYQARREIRSFWFPTWLAQPAAMVPDSRLVDAPARGLTLEAVLPLAGDYEFLVLHTSAPSFSSDVKVAESFKAANPKLLVGMVGAHVAVSPESSVAASEAIDFVARAEFDYTLKEIAEGRPIEEVDGITYKADGRVVHNPDRALIHDMDALPFVTEVYKRDLVIEDYFIGYLLHPYVSLYTGRGCKSRCTFCLWPQTIGGHVYRTRSPERVAAEIALAKSYFPQVREFFFDDDTFTDNLPRAEAIARELGRIGVTWSCNAKANVPRETLKILKDNGLRLLLVGYESGNQQILHNIKKGMRIDVARRFTEDCHKLGIRIHGTFIIGLPGETKETIEETIRWAMARPIDEALTAVVQMIDQKGNVVAEHSSLIVGATGPTSTMRPNDIAIDAHRIVLPNAIATLEPSSGAISMAAMTMATNEAMPAAPGGRRGAGRRRARAGPGRGRAGGGPRPGRPRRGHPGRASTAVDGGRPQRPGPFK